ncbi:PD-(D/E)XK nuclease domain-containing protein [Turicimonas sp. TL08]
MVVGNPLRSRRGGCQIEQLLAGKTLEQGGADRIVHRLGTEGAESIVCMLNRLFASLDYVNYPVRNEASLRAFIQVFFSGAGLEPIVEHHNAHGRSDLEVRAGEKVWLIELKVANEGENSERLLREAIEQIRERRYGYSLLDKTLIRVALVFSLEKKEFIRRKAFA